MEKPNSDPQLDAVYTVVSRELFAYSGTDIQLFREACGKAGITPSVMPQALKGEVYDPNRSAEVVGMLFEAMRVSGMSPDPQDLANKADAQWEYQCSRWLEFDEKANEAEEGSEAEREAEENRSIAGLIEAAYADTRDLLRKMAAISA